jgi:hypothetical protein
MIELLPKKRDCRAGQERVGDIHCDIEEALDSGLDSFVDPSLTRFFVSLVKVGLCE